MYPSLIASYLCLAGTSLALPQLQFHLQQQHAISSADPAADLSAELFRSIYGSLKSWSQAFQPNGRAAIPAIIPSGTLLYHGRGDSHPPTSGIDWFALDPEHAYMFASRGSDSTFNTYVATRPLKVLYFDGFSASKGNPGSMDLQNLIAFGLSGHPPERFEDGVISEGLCKWGLSKGLDGFVREEANFEVIWCDFGSKAARLVHQVNSTRSDVDFGPPGRHHRGPPPADHLSQRRQAPPAEFKPMRGDHMKSMGVPPGPPGGSHHWQMLSAASQHYHAREPRVQLAIQHMSSLTAASYTSLSEIYKQPSYERRLLEISQNDLSNFMSQLESNIERWQAGDMPYPSLEFLGTADVIAQKTSPRLQRMSHSLGGSYASSTIMDVVEEALGMLQPYLNVPHTVWEGENKPDARTRRQGIRQAVEACSTAYTSFIERQSLTSSEDSIINSFEGVLGRICQVSGSIIEDHLSMKISSLSAGMKARYETETLKIWRRKTNELMEWLDWPEWQSCMDCAGDEICYVPMWPIIINEDGEPQGPPSDGRGAPIGRPLKRPEPRCVKRMG